jgi:hypothetical protein
MRARFEPLPVCFVNVMLAPPGKDMISDLFDVLMRNCYYGWYVNTGDLPGASSTRGPTSTVSRSSSRRTVPTFSPDSTA